MDGVLERADQSGRTWAWIAVRIDAAVDMLEIQALQKLNETERYQFAIEEQTRYLQGLLDVSFGRSVELRISHDPRWERLRVHLLGVVSGDDPAATRHEAVALRDRLLLVPPQAVASAVLDDEEAASTLMPFDAHPDGMVRIRKRRLYGTPQRSDANVPYYFAVQPLTAAPRSWNQFLATLASCDHPVVFTTGLQPIALDANFSNYLEAQSTLYSRLAVDGTDPGGVTTKQTAKLTADAFCVDAQKLYQDASRRYRERGYLLRVQLVSSWPIDAGFAELAGGTISPQTNEGANYIESQSVGTPFSIERPRSDEERAEFVTEFMTASHLARVMDPPRDAYACPPDDRARLLASIVDPREAVAAFRLPIAADRRLPGIPVRNPPSQVTSDYVPRTAHVTLGSQLDVGRPVGTVTVETRDLASHALFVGTTGSGKTSTVLHFLDQLWRDHQVPFLVIEPVNWDSNDYRWFMNLPGYESMVTFTVGNESAAPLRLNPFEVQAGVLVGDHIASLKRCFVGAFGLWDPLPAIYNEALLETYISADILPNELAGARHADRWPTLRDFANAMDRVVADPTIFEYAGEIRSNLLAASKIRARQLVNGPCADMLDTRYSFPISELLSRPVVVELGRIGGDPKEQALAISLLFNAIAQHIKQLGASPTLRHVTVIEEAHRLLKNPTPAGGSQPQGDASSESAEMFENILAENRKYGAGVAIVEQDPEKLIPGSYKNTYLKVMHRLPADADRGLIGSTMNLNDDQRRFAATLVTHEALVYHAALGRAAHMRVPNIRAARAAEGHNDPLPNDNEIRPRFEALRQSTPSIDRAMRPYTGCDECAHVCEFRGQARAMASRSASRQRFTEYVGAAGKSVSASWWAGLIDLLDDIGHVDTSDGGALDGSARTDQRCCTMLHFLRAWLPSSAAVPKWIDRVRRESRSLEAPP